MKTILLKSITLETSQVKALCAVISSSILKSKGKYFLNITTGTNNLDLNIYQMSWYKSNFIWNLFDTDEIISEFARIADSFYLYIRQGTFVAADVTL